MFRIVSIIVVPFLAVMFLPAAYAQKQNNVWVLGINAQLDFNVTPPVVSAMVPVAGSGSGGVASVCDAAGQLLFYTDGESVWNRLNQVMPNGAGLHSFAGANQESVIMAAPGGNPQRYYLFTRNDQMSLLNVSLIDLSLDGGLGDIVPDQKTLPLADSISTGLCAIPGDGCNAWLVAHHKYRSEFVAFRVGAAGVEAAPVVSTSGFFNGLFTYYVCDLCASPTGDRIGLASDGNNFVELHHFDRATGVVSGAALLDHFSSVGRAHAVCFSPGGQRLYITGGPSGSDLVQYDLTNPAAITSTQISTTGNFNGGLRLAPDGKIYCANYNEIATIQQPDLPGAACGLSLNYVSMPGDVETLPRQLGNDVFFLPPVVTTAHSRDTILCRGTTLDVKAATSGYDRFAWSDGDTSTMRVMTQPSVLWLTDSAACALRTDTLRVQVPLCDCAVLIPDAFTPNNDGRNDRFAVSGQDVTEATLRVYNRFGQMVYESASSANTGGWNGTFNGQSCEMGVYFYQARAQCRQGKAVEKKGTVTLIR